MKKKIAIVILFAVFIFLVVTQKHMDMVPVDLTNKLAPMSFEHLMGTDVIGRDLYELMLVGCLRSFLVVMIAGTISLVVGVTVGILSGYFKGNISMVLQFFTDFLLIIPTFIVALLATAVFGLNPVSAGIALGLCQMGHFANHAAELTREIKEKEYISILRVMGYPEWRILFFHVLPGILPLVFPFFGAMASSNILQYASLAFIGLGGDITKPDWGTMLYEYRVYILNEPLLVLWPSLGIFLMAVIFQFLFDTKKVEAS